MEKEIDLYTNFSNKDIEEFKKVGINLCQDLDRICFTKYCRNLVNFIINNTKFNYLIEFLSQVNSEILNDYQNNKHYVKEIINLNNILLDMIKNEEFIPEHFQGITSDMNIISQYISFLTMLNDINYNNNICIVGSYKIDRIYINYLVTKDAILKYDGQDIIYLNDIYNNFICLSSKIAKYYQNQPDKKNIINNIIFNFKSKKNINYVSKSIDEILLLMNDIKEIQPYVDSFKPRIVSKKEKNLELPLILGATITLGLAFALRLSS